MLDNIHVSTGSCASQLQWCIKRKDLKEGKKVHDMVIRNGFEFDVFIGNLLVDMYAKCGSLGDARQVFDKMRKRNVFSWTAMILAYAKHGQYEGAIDLFKGMPQEGVVPDKVTFAVVLKACTSLATLELGRQDMLNKGFAMMHSLCSKKCNWKV